LILPVQIPCHRQRPRRETRVERGDHPCPRGKGLRDVQFPRRVYLGKQPPVIPGERAVKHRVRSRGAVNEIVRHRRRHLRGARTGGSWGKIIPLYRMPRDSYAPTMLRRPCFDLLEDIRPPIRPVHLHNPRLLVDRRRVVIVPEEFIRERETVYGRRLGLHAYVVITRIVPAADVYAGDVLARFETTSA